MRLPPPLRNASIGLLGALALVAGAWDTAGGEEFSSPELLAADHPSWRDLVGLWNRGGLPELPVFTRPLPRSDIAVALARTCERSPELAALAVTRRLRREFAFELERLGYPSNFRETPPFLEIQEDVSTLRAQPIARIRWTFTDDAGDVLPETAAGVGFRAYLTNRAFAFVEAVVEDIEGDRPLGDAIVKNSDWYLSVPNAYLSIRTSAADFYAGLLEHRWGPGSTGTLLLSEGAISYPGLFYGRTFGSRARFTAVTGALQPSQKRWFSAHRLEIAFREDLRVGLHESAAYPSTGVDVLYAVGLVPYTLVQRYFDRTVTPPGTVADHRNNLIVGADLVWRFAQGWRLDGEFLIDDFATETSTQPHRLAYQGGFSWAGSLAGGSADVRAEYVKVYRYTYAVFYGADLILEGVPLGYVRGPDLEHGTLFLERDFGIDTRLGFGVDLTRGGEGAAGEFWDRNDPQSQNAASVLSGTVETRLFPHARFERLVRDIVRVEGRVGVVRVTNRDHVEGRDETLARGEIVARVEW